MDKQIGNATPICHDKRTLKGGIAEMSDHEKRIAALESLLHPSTGDKQHNSITDRLDALEEQQMLDGNAFRELEAFVYNRNHAVADLFDVVKNLTTRIKALEERLDSLEWHHGHHFHHSEIDHCGLPPSADKPQESGPSDTFRQPDKPNQAEPLVQDSAPSQVNDAALSQVNDAEDLGDILVPVEDLTECLGLLCRARACILATAEIPLRPETVSFPKTLRAIEEFMERVGHKHDPSAIDEVG